MLQNRYDNILREYNQDIINLSPANQTMRIELALEIKNILQKNPESKILELGVGEGNLTEYILKYNPGISLDCLDVSPEMIDSAKKVLGNIPNIHFLQEDANEYLQNPSTNEYGIITSSWTIHNFPWYEKNELFANIYHKLHTDGVMLLMDKIYPDDYGTNLHLLRLQNARHKYLPEIAKEAIINHELQDFDAIYKMQESHTKKVLQGIGFRDIEILDRIERDTLLIARKS